MFGTILTIALIFAFFLTWAFYGGVVASLWAFLGTISIVGTQVVVITSAVTPLRTIASSSVGLTTYQLALILAILAVPGWRVLRNLNPLLAVLPLLMLTVNALENHLAPQIVSGILQLSFIAVAWGFGASVAEQVRVGRLSDRTLVLILVIMTTAQATAVALQAIGVLDSDSSAVGSESVSRLSGLMSHSGQLGKLLLLFLIILLPFTRSGDRIARRLTLGTIFVITAMTAATYSRANMLALGVILGIWFVAGGRGSLIKRLAIPTIAFLAVLPALGTLLLRQEFDEDGGSRPVLMVSAMRQISETFLWGTGPNNYLTVVSQFDPLAAGGLPVHNSAILLLAELGLVGFVLLALPFLALVVRAAGGVPKGGPARSTSIVVLAAAPGVGLIIATGHGMTAADMFPLFAFVCGYAWRSIGATGIDQAKSDGFNEGLREPRRPSSSERRARSARFAN